MDNTNQLKKSLLIKERFLNSVSHEIRGPAQVICVLADGMLDKVRQYSDEERLEMVAQISYNTKRIFDLVNNWMDMSSLSTTNQLAFDMTKNNLLDSIKTILKSVRVLAEEKGVRVSFAKQDTDKTEEFNLVFNKERITQVVHNICANAIKFSKKNDEIIVDLFKETLEQDGKKIKGFCVSIKDQGVGIPKDEIKSIFNSFVQGSKSKGKAGLGLGLSLSKEIITRHNGKIWVENNKEGGCTFYFFIPFFNYRNIKTFRLFYVCGKQPMNLISIGLML